MKRTPAARTPVQLGALLNSHPGSVSAPLNCLHHRLQAHQQHLDSQSVPGHDYETQPFDMLGISTLPLELDLETPPSPVDGLQPSMIDHSLESENCSSSTGLSHSPLQNHRHHHQSSQNHHSHSPSQIIPHEMSHIHRNSYSDSNSPSVVSSLSSSCSVSPQSTDLPFGMLSTYQVANTTGSAVTLTNNKDCVGLENTTLSGSFTDSPQFIPSASSSLTSASNSTTNPVTISVMQQQQRHQQNSHNNNNSIHNNSNSNNFMIFDFETSSSTPGTGAAAVLLASNNSNNTNTNIANNINIINAINSINSSNGHKVTHVYPSSDNKSSLPLSSTPMLINNNHNSSNNGIALCNQQRKTVPIGTPTAGISSNGHVCSGITNGNGLLAGNGHAHGHSNMICTGTGSVAPSASHGSSTSKSHCKVCGDTAIGKNFGVLTCGSCKIFFRRNCNEDKCKLLCRNNNNCVITKSNRRNCARCRLQKCRDLGMKLKQSRHSRDIRRDISADESDGQHCCPAYSSHCTLHHACVSGSVDDCPVIPDDLPSLISEDEVQRRCEAKQCLIDRDSEAELLDYVIAMQEGDDECEDDFSDVDDVPAPAADDVTFQDTFQETSALPIVESSAENLLEKIPDLLPEVCVQVQQQQQPQQTEECQNISFQEVAQQVQNEEIESTIDTSAVRVEENLPRQRQDSDSDVEEAVPRPEFDLDSADLIDLSHQIRVATFLKSASEQDWENYKEVLGGPSKLDLDELPEDFDQRILEFLSHKNRKRLRNDVELIKAEARNLPSKIDHQITELCQMTSFIRINMGLEFQQEDNSHVPALMNKELERINGLNKSCQMIDIKPKNGQKDFSVSDSLKQGIFYADKSFKLLEKFWRLNPELKEMIMINEKAFDTRKKNLLHMLYHLRGVYNFDDNQDAWLVPNEMETNTATYIKLTMFNQSIKKEMTTIHKKYIDSFPKLWREDLTIFNLMTFLLFFRTFDELRSQYKCEKMRYYSVMYLLMRYLENLYGNKQEALAMLHRVLTLIKDLKWLCTECLNACTHSFNLDVLQEVAPNYADLLRTEDAKNAQQEAVEGGSSCAFSQCKKARCEN